MLVEPDAEFSSDEEDEEDADMVSKRLELLSMTDAIDCDSGRRLMGDEDPRPEPEPVLDGKTMM